MSEMSMALDYAREKAPEDVRASLDWLTQEGFALAGELGGPGESFGNLRLDFEQLPLTVRITRDRGQWFLELAFVRADFIPLNVLLTAMNGDVPDPWGRDLADPLPEVLPGGVAWHEVLPAVISWLDSADTTTDVGEARAAWTAAMKRWWASRQSKTTT